MWDGYGGGAERPHLEVTFQVEFNRSLRSLTSKSEAGHPSRENSEFTGTEGWTSTMCPRNCKLPEISA